MKSNMISVEDIRNIGSGGTLKVQLPNYGATVAARNQVSYVRRAYPRDDGMTYATSTDASKNIITIEVVTTEEYERRNNK